MTEEEVKQAKIIEMGASLEEFSRTCFPHAWKVPCAEFHHSLYQDLNNDSLSELVIVAPRGHGKTVLSATIKPLHQILYSALMGKGHEFVVIVSKTAGHAESVLATIKEELDTNDYLHYYFGNWGKDTAKQWNVAEIQLKNKSTITALGMGSQFHGLIRDFQRPSLYILDDPEDDKNASTQASMKENMRWFEKALMAGRDPQRSRVIVIGTMINDGCMVDRFYKESQKSDAWVGRWYKAIPDKNGMEWSGDESWPVLWPDWWPMKKLMAEKRRAESTFTGPEWWMNYQNEFKADENQPFKRENFRFYKGDLIELSKTMHALKIEWMKDSDGNIIAEDVIIPLNIFWGYDPASSLSARADETSICFYGMDFRKNLFRVWGKHARLDPIKAAEIFFEKAQELKPTSGNIETVQAQETIRSYLRELCDQNNTWIPGIDKKNQPRTRKSLRLQQNRWRFERGMVYVRECDDDVVSQYAAYVVDKEAQHEDILDADYYAFLNAYECDVDWMTSEEEAKLEAQSSSGFVMDDWEDIGETTWMAP